MKAMIGGLISMGVDEPTPGVFQPTMEFDVLIYEDNGQLIAERSINVPFNASTNQNQLLPLAKTEVINTVQSLYNRSIGTNDIKSAVLQ